MTYSYELYEEPERKIVWVVNNGHRNIKTFPDSMIEEAVALMLSSREQGVVEQLQAYLKSPYDHWKYRQKEPSVLPFRVSVEHYEKMFKEEVE